MAVNLNRVPVIREVACPRPTRVVSDASSLAGALRHVKGGDVIALEDGAYAGRFVATASGSPGSPIYLCGSPRAVLAGDGPRSGYVFHLDGGDHWRLVGFTIRNGQKGLVADSTVGSVFQGLTVEQIGDEAIHLRTHSTDNLVLANTVRHTGLRREKFGEGIYVGSAVSNWCRYTRCKPDRSDRNVIARNTVSFTTAEALDIKEGSSGGYVLDNTFDGSALRGADSWVDVKGNGWLVQGNRGTNSPGDGFQTHDVAKGWGQGNVFRRNVAEVHGPGHGFALRPVNDNVVMCDNVARGAARGLSNAQCVKPH
ncbi:right-handed parallel beta-helix repeat-containing protein [Deinococcus peraridilitoris]|uniref:Uncharacterized protein n=1 Tax=Deinococcus peraridilitoris (strain DSM 19664 / LMG 22246 / CIP 109416 / KR-200) TaxID=937777 RepID=L0A5X8_DEIPD|nr:right-handed parallel beta-helix repeat-containing protein [Deinococcus peraridilitoris]AFZ68849.1 hypothetical protein Deipe_3413 [Deinococcus peraridilitoris DSM 19664]